MLYLIFLLIGLVKSDIPLNYKFSYLYNTTDEKMWFSVIVPVNTYFAIGFETSMKSAGMIFLSG